MIGVKMGKEHRVEGEAGPVADHLPLRAFAAVEEEALGLALDAKSPERLRCAVGAAAEVPRKVSLAMDIPLVLTLPPRPLKRTGGPP